MTNSTDSTDGATEEAAGVEAPSRAPDPEQVALPPGTSSAGNPGGAALNLVGYARRLEREGEQGLAGAVREYAERVGAVERGELPAALSVAPAAISPTMVGAVLVRPRLEGFLELFRNVLVFIPVLWTWLKLQAAVSSYPPDAQTNFFDFWVKEGGTAPVIGGTLADAALQVALILVLLVVANALLGILRGQTEGRREREARRFAAVLARAEAAGVVQWVGDSQPELTGSPLATGGGEVPPPPLPLTEASAAGSGQQQRLDDVIEQLRGIAAMGEQLAALRAEFSETREAAERSAEALTAIRDSLDPSARDFTAAAETLVGLATHVERMTDAMAGTIASLENGLDSSAEELRGAALSMNAVAARVLDEIGDGR